MANAEFGEVSGQTGCVIEGEAGMELDAIGGARFDHLRFSVIQSCGTSNQITASGGSVSDNEKSRP
jgi:hypothetical protein